MLIDGQPADRIPVSDRGLQYGDGLFETIAVTDGEPRLWEAHMERLTQGEARLGFPLQDKSLLLAETRELLSDTQRGVLKLLLTRGSGGRGYRAPHDVTPRRMLTLHPWPDYPDSWFTAGIRLRVCETRIGRSRALAGLKHLNRLEQVLARNEWDDPEIAEGVMLDENDLVVEGTQSNLFMLSEGCLLTPDLTDCGVAGVMRRLVLELANQLGIETVIKKLTLQECKAGDALFITNSIMGICPVSDLEERRFAVESIPERLVLSVQKQAFGKA
ncbi:MAG: 4-amino-4-deoxychorismate lyase [Gammaproteobacteria bacterium (ex Lamellibrachia satsuma)]|nr:MAG: aminodeoxychorismate lyase [Gammaproteobacteria bacterium (ex Lamellibrachia satsuma)]RRS32997.1 MAG: 4-amino-4-deoxychorismate lyase [Gammaproteobacteria bacterium (ex Lamellibrachia satsuma)]RRS36618.1 MAG: 4-amino-4-deoxychorismate lyase [Gammaproteobacteria bacterium (ex Lamellibrachia satsuma)]